MKNIQIIEHLNALGNFTKEKLPVKLSFAIVRNTNMLKQVYSDFEHERNKLLDSYNIKDKDGEPAWIKTGNIEIEKSKIKNWTEDVEELLNIDVNIDVYKISISAFENLDLSTKDIEAIEFMIIE